MVCTHVNYKTSMTYILTNANTHTRTQVMSSLGMGAAATSISSVGTDTSGASSKQFLAGVLKRINSVNVSSWLWLCVGGLSCVNVPPKRWLSLRTALVRVLKIILFSKCF